MSTSIVRSVCDLETLGIAAGCPVLSIGITWQASVYPRDIHSTKILVSRKANRDLGLVPDHGTIQWWAKPKLVEAWAMANDLAGEFVVHQNWDDALQDLWMWMNMRSQPDEIWANGASFDFPIIRHISNLVGHPLPWSPFNERCFRTVKAYYPEIPWEDNSHDAEEDALNQHRFLNLALPLPPP